MSSQVTDFCQIGERLRFFWVEKGCLPLYPYDMPMGAGTYHPDTFFGVLSSSPLAICYVQPSRRPQDGRYGQSGNRVYQHHQFQVVLKPIPKNAQELAYESLRTLGIDEGYDLRFVENNWESPLLGARGVGWEVWCDGMEIMQYTYFQRMGGADLKEGCVEYAYGMERLALILQEVDTIMDLRWSSDVTYGQIKMEYEKSWSAQVFQNLRVERERDALDKAIEEGFFLLEQKNCRAAYEALLQASHIFNLLHGYGAMGVAERADFVLRLRKIAEGCRRVYHESSTPLE